MANDETFHGTFEPPTIGTSGTPIGMAGVGSLTITPDALVVKGFHGGGFLFPLLALVTVTGAGLGVAWLVTTKVFHHDSMSPGAIGAVIAGGLLSAAAVPKNASKRPFELSIPWTSVKKALVHGQSKDVQITIKKFKPKGVLHFKPTDGATSPVLAAVMAKLT